MKPHPNLWLCLAAHVFFFGKETEATITDKTIANVLSDVHESTVDGYNSRGLSAAIDSEEQSDYKEVQRLIFRLAVAFPSMLVVLVCLVSICRCVGKWRLLYQRELQLLEVKTELPKLQRVGVHADELPDDLCAICLCEIHNGSDLILFPCNHRVHADCVVEWLGMRMQCPICRGPLRSLKECVVENVLCAHEGGQRSALSHEMCHDPSWWKLPSTIANRVAVEVQPQLADSGSPVNKPDQLCSPPNTPETIALSQSALSLASTWSGPSTVSVTDTSFSSDGSLGSPAPTLIGQASLDP